MCGWKHNDAVPVVNALQTKAVVQQRWPGCWAISSQVRTLNPQATSVAVGDEVVIGINEQALVRGSLAVYTVPLLMLFVFGFFGQLLSTQLLMTNQDILPIVLGLSGLLLGFVWVRRFTRRIADDVRYQPVLLRRVIDITLR